MVLIHIRCSIFHVRRDLTPCFSCLSIYFFNFNRVLILSKRLFYVKLAKSNDFLLQAKPEGACYINQLISPLLNGYTRGKFRVRCSTSLGSTLKIYNRLKANEFMDATQQIRTTPLISKRFFFNTFSAYFRNYW